MTEKKKASTLQPRIFAPRMFAPRMFAPLIALAMLLCATASNLHAQDAADARTDDFESALFGDASPAPDARAEPDGALTAAFDAEAAEGEKARTEYLAGGTVAVKAASTADFGTGSLAVLSDAEGKLFGKVTVPDYGSLFIAYTVSHGFFQGYAGDGIAPPARDQYEPDIALSELHYSFDIGKKLFFRVGNQLLSWGPSRVWSPVDFINLQREDSFAEIDSRAGKSGLKVHFPTPRANAFFFADFSGMTEGGTYGDPGETVNLGGRLDFTATGFEFGLTGYGGKNAQGRVGADFSGRLFGTTVYGELAIEPDASETGIQAALGFSRVLGELKNWTLSAEGFYNSSGQDLSGYTAAGIMALPADERTPLYQGTYYAYASLAAGKLFSPSLAASLSGLANLEDRSYSIKLSESFSFPRAVPFTFAVSFAGGGDDREFTRFAGDNSITATLSTKLEF